MAWQDRMVEWKNIQEVEQKLGEISMIWSATDRNLNEWVSLFLDISDAEAAAILSGMLPKKKCEIIKRLMVMGCPSDEWSTTALELLAQIDKWGAVRNRLVHDAWRFNENTIHRIDGRAQIQKVPHNPAQFQFDEHVIVTKEEMEELCRTGHETLSAMRDLSSPLVFWMLQRREELYRLLS
jgi:hypothetical protein